MEWTKSAQEYFTDGITASVKGYDYVASQNHIPYYDSPYVNDPHDVSIKLQDEWLTELLKKEAYILSGDKVSDLEKVYIQEYLHYFNAPIDQYVNIMRSGVPMKIVPFYRVRNLTNNWVIPILSLEDLLLRSLWNQISYMT